MPSSFLLRPLNDAGISSISCATNISGLKRTESLFELQMKANGAKWGSSIFSYILGYRAHIVDQHEISQVIIKEGMAHLLAYEYFGEYRSCDWNQHVSPDRNRPSPHNSQYSHQLWAGHLTICYFALREESFTDQLRRDLLRAQRINNRLANPACDILVRFKLTRISTHLPTK